MLGFVTKYGESNKANSGKKIQMMPQLLRIAFYTLGFFYHTVCKYFNLDVQLLINNSFICSLFQFDRKKGSILPRMAITFFHQQTLFYFQVTDFNKEKRQKIHKAVKRTFGVHAFTNTVDSENNRKLLKIGYASGKNDRKY